MKSKLANSMVFKLYQRLRASGISGMQQSTRIERQNGAMVRGYGTAFNFFSDTMRLALLLLIVIVNRKTTLLKRYK